MVVYLGIDLVVFRVVLIIEFFQLDCEVLCNVMDYFENYVCNYLVMFIEFNELIIIKFIMLKEGKWNICQEMGELQIFKLWVVLLGFSCILVGGYFVGEMGLY